MTGLKWTCENLTTLLVCHINYKHKQIHESNRINRQNKSLVGSNNSSLNFAFLRSSSSKHVRCRKSKPLTHKLYTFDVIALLLDATAASTCFPSAHFFHFQVEIPLCNFTSDVCGKPNLCDFKYFKADLTWIILMLIHMRRQMRGTKPLWRHLKMHVERNFNDGCIIDILCSTIFLKRMWKCNYEFHFLLMFLWNENESFEKN